MSTELATANVNGAAPAPATVVDPATLERVVCDGDLSKLNPAQRVVWYKARCEAAGLDPRTQPFQYVSLSGKVVLYATKTATDQLIAKHEMSVQILSRNFDPDTGIYEVHCRATFPGGRSAEDIGALFVGSAKGEMLANAVMKAVTKAKRRTVLSACGLGMLDESEVDSIPGAERPGREPQPADPTAHYARNLTGNATGHGSGAYAPPDAVRDWAAWRDDFTARANARWLDLVTDRETGEVDPSVKGDLVRTHQLSGHVLKWAKDSGMVEAPADGAARPAQVDKLVAVAWSRDKEAVIAECRRYVKAKCDEAMAKLAPEDESQEPGVPSEETPEDQGDPDIDYPEPGAGG